MSKSVIAKSVAELAAQKKSGALEVQKGKECTLALEMLACGAKYSEICEKTGLSPSNVSKLKVRHAGAIEQRRLLAAEEFEDIADVYKEVLRRKADQLLTDDEALKKINPKDLALTAAIGTDKPMQLRGEATSVVEHRKGASLEDVLAMKADLAKRVVDVEVEDV